MFACKPSSDPEQAVAIEVTLPDSGRVEVTDSFFPSARALNGDGDSVAATIYWSSFDSLIIRVLDSTTGVSLAESVGTGRLQARVEAIRSNPLPVQVLARLDSIATSATRTTVTAPDSLSDSLVVTTTSTGGAASGRRVVFAATTYPPGDSTVRFVPNDTVFTSSAGVASVQLKFFAGVPPDSVVVTATMRRLDGTPIPGSPVTFVVEFLP